MEPDLKKRIDDLKLKLDPDKIRQEIRVIEAESSKPEFWQDHQGASEKMKTLAGLQDELEQLDDLAQLYLDGKTEELTKKLEQLELKTFFSGEYDSANAIFSIHAGQGGTEAMDWAQMLQRMYQKYFEKKGWKHEFIEETQGEEAGVKSVSMLVTGTNVYGYLKHEAGTHRLVRQSPFNADKLRQTSFALVEVLPEVKDEKVNVKEDDLEWEFFRASSHGGQNVQKVSTAVRLKHKPTGIIVTSQNERYQEQNRKIALNYLKAKLWQKAESEARVEEQRLKGGRTQAAWGTQIRSYVLHPYKMVKDLRTDFETSNAEAVLNGELDGFVEAEIRFMV